MGKGLAGKGRAPGGLRDGAARGAFKSYGPEEEAISRPNARPKENPGAARMRDALLGVSKDCSMIEGMIDKSMIGEPFAFYAMFLVRASGFSYSNQDMQEFLFRHAPERALLDEEGHFALLGLLVSALVTAGKGREYSLRLDHLEQTVPFLGFNNLRKNAAFRANADFSFGAHNVNGILELHGDCHDCGIGEDMIGGQLTIHVSVGVGDVESSTNLGRNMSGGILIVEGDLGDNVIVGPLGRGSEVHLNGNGDFGISDEGLSLGSIFRRGREVLRGRNQ